MTNFTSMTTFCGADSILVVNKKIIGEADTIFYKENLLAEEGEPKFNGKIDIVVFNEEPVLRNAIREQRGEAEVYMRYSNEYGQQMLIQFTHVMFLERVGVSSVDMVVPKESYAFTAHDMLYYGDGQFTFDFETNEVTIHETV